MSLRCEEQTKRVKPRKIVQLFFMYACMLKMKNKAKNSNDKILTDSMITWFQARHLIDILKIKP